MGPDRVFRDRRRRPERCARRPRQGTGPPQTHSAVQQVLCDSTIASFFQQPSPHVRSDRTRPTFRRPRSLVTCGGEAGVGRISHPLSSHDHGRGPRAAAKIIYEKPDTTIVALLDRHPRTGSEEFSGELSQERQAFWCGVDGCLSRGCVGLPGNFQGGVAELCRYRT